MHVADMIQWEYQQKLLYDQHQSQQQFQRQEQQKVPYNFNSTAGAMSGKVVTDEQLETLRKQITVYGVICEKLEQKVIKLAPQDLQEFRAGQLYGQSLMTSTAPRMISRQRWQPTVEQVQILENMFNQETVTPTRESVKEITAELKLYGAVKETNVYNWFQNRRARLKRKQRHPPSNQNTVNPKVDTENKSMDINNNLQSQSQSHHPQPHPQPQLQPQPQPQPQPQSQDESAKSYKEHCFQCPSGSSDMHFLGSHTNEEDPIAMLISDNSLNPTMSYTTMPVWEETLSKSNYSL